MTTEPPATNATASTAPMTWEALEEKAKRANGDPFYPIGDAPDGKAIKIRVSAIEMDPARFQGKFSLFEMGGEIDGKAYRICVSGTRLAGAIAAIKPQIGDLLILTPDGPAGRERRWTAERPKLVMNARLA